MEYVYTQNSPEIKYLADSDDKLKGLIERIGDLCYTTTEESYEFIVGTVIGQMLSSKVADLIYSRFVKLCGGIVTPQTVAKLTNDEIRAISISIAKTYTIRATTNLFLSTQNLSQLLATSSDNVVTIILTQIRGIGTWTAKMYLIFVLNRMDILPYEDGAFIQAIERLYGGVRTLRW